MIFCINQPNQTSSKKVIDSYDISGRKWGMDMNMSKTEAQAVNGAQRQKFTSLSGPIFDTHDATTNLPREFYKDLDV